MKEIGICAAFEPGLKALRLALPFKEQIAFVATSEKDKSSFSQQIAELAEKNGIPCFEGINPNSKEFQKTIAPFSIELGILAWWPTILKSAIIAIPKRGWVNLHPSLLPFNRGKHPYYWSIVEGTKFGATIHLIDEGIDTGAILFQREIPVSMADTGESLYVKGVDACVDLFGENVEQIFRLDLKPIPQTSPNATYHHSSEIESHSKIDLGKTYKGEELLNILRGRTFWQGDSAYFLHEGRKYRVKVKIEEMD